MSTSTRGSRRWAGLAVTALAIAVLAGCGGDDSGGGDEAASGGEPYKIGVPVDLTGPAATIGVAHRDAAQAVADEVNAAGGVNGREIELMVEDGKSDPTEGARIVTNMLRNGDVIGIYGTSTSTGTLAFLPVTAREGVAVTTGGAAPDITDPSKPWFPLTFSVVPDQVIFNQVIGDQMEKDGNSQVAVLYQEDANSATQAESFKEQVAEGGGLDLVEEVAVPSDATDVSGQISRLARANPDAIYLITIGVDVTAAALRALGDVGYEGDVYAGPGVVQQALIDAAGDAAEGLVAVSVINPSDPAATPRLAKLLKGKGGIQGFGSLLGADGMATLVAGLEADPADGEELAKAIDDAGPIQGYGRAPLRFSADNHVGFSPEGVVVVRVEGGDWATVE